MDAAGGEEVSESMYCGLGICAAMAGHEGTCDEASGWADLPEPTDPDGWNAHAESCDDEYCQPNGVNE
tara:strand:- start:338 stop:541 length:204 start_codon:yes stop_codon:yes gene_type:complete